MEYFNLTSILTLTMEECEDLLQGGEGKSRKLVGLSFYPGRYRSDGDDIVIRQRLSCSKCLETERYSLFYNILDKSTLR